MNETDSRPESPLRPSDGTEATGSALPAGSAYSIEEALYQLQVRQLELQAQNYELEAQNLALRKSQQRLAACHDQLVNLYHLAPVAAMRLDDANRIGELNHSAASLLALPRQQAIGSELASFVLVDDRDSLAACLLKARNTPGRHSGHLRMQKVDGSPFHAQLDCMMIRAGLVPHALWLTLTDLSILEAKQRIRDEFYARLDKLTRRERDVLALALDGISTKEISDRLGISLRTAETHRSRICLKLEIHSLAELPRMAAQSGLSPGEIITSIGARKG